MLDIGIDFGSTYTTVSVYRQETGSPEAHWARGNNPSGKPGSGTRPNKYGPRMTPVANSPRTEGILTREARRPMPWEANNTTPN